MGKSVHSASWLGREDAMGAIAVVVGTAAAVVAVVVVVVVVVVDSWAGREITVTVLG